MTSGDIFRFLKDKDEKLGVLATVSQEGKPECAVVGYAAQDDGTIIINTNKNSRKINNIRVHSAVAMVIGWKFDDKNVQYEGTADIIERDHTDFPSCEDFFFTTNPAAVKFKSPDTIFIRIKPSWVRMLDLTIAPPVTDEFALRA